MFSPNQDVIFQEVKLFIEGVQVPFNSIQVNSGIGTLPSANISVPPFPGLMDICRYYQPKVHIFYTDPYLDGETKREEKEKRECVLFMGVIAGVTFSKSRQGGFSQITFNCNHKNAFFNDVLLDYNSPMDNSVIGATGVRNDVAVGMPLFNSEQSIQMALKGIVPASQNKDKLSIEAANTAAIVADNNKAEPSLLNTKWNNSIFEKRYKGFPGVLMNLWNQLKLNAVKVPIDYESMVKMYIPLIEDGIKFFDRVSGHYYIENLMDAGKQPPCDYDGKGVLKDSDKQLVPPSMRLFVQSTAQSQITLNLFQQQLGWSGELTDFMSIFRRLLEVIDYEMITLTSPAESSIDPSDPSDEATTALETIIKPQLPFYYSPSCNIYYPYMYHSLNVQQDEAGVPTRITLSSRILPSAGSTLHKNYRAPASVREAIVKGYIDDEQAAATNHEATNEEQQKKYSESDKQKLYDKANLLSSTDGIKNRLRIGTYELGRGIKHRRYELPYWLTLYPAANKEIQEIPSDFRDDQDHLLTLKNAWNYRFGDIKSHLNPYSDESGVAPHERLMFCSADYRFTMEVAASRMGTLSGIFNPYVIPGYPIDILDPNPTNPCFHGLCSSVTHNITSNSISTDVSFVAVVTYTELANYYLQFVNPWLQVSLKIVSGYGQTISGQTGELRFEKYTSSIVNNPNAAAVAEKDFYYPTLGVGSLAPDELYDFNKGTIKPIQLKSSIRHGEQREENPMLSAQGNLLLVRRPIETREKVQGRFGISFIDMEQNNYNPNVIKYTDEVLDDSRLLEPGQSQFLDYTEIPGSLPET